MEQAKGEGVMKTNYFYTWHSLSNDIVDNIVYLYIFIILYYVCGTVTWWEYSVVST